MATTQSSFPPTLSFSKTALFHSKGWLFWTSLASYVTLERTACFPSVVGLGRGEGGPWPLNFFYIWIPLWIGIKQFLKNSRQKLRFMSPHGLFLQPILYYKSNFQIASNDFKFGMHLVPRILIPVVKLWAQSDQRFNSYSVFWAIFEKTFQKKLDLIF